MPDYTGVLMANSIIPQQLSVNASDIHWSMHAGVVVISAFCGFLLGVFFVRHRRTPRGYQSVPDVFES